MELEPQYHQTGNGEAAVAQTQLPDAVQPLTEQSALPQRELEEIANGAHEPGAQRSVETTFEQPPVKSNKNWTEPTFGIESPPRFFMNSGTWSINWLPKGAKRVKNRAMRITVGDTQQFIDRQLSKVRMITAAWKDKRHPLEPPKRIPTSDAEREYQDNIVNFHNEYVVALADLLMASGLVPLTDTHEIDAKWQSEKGDEFIFRRKVAVRDESDRPYYKYHIGKTDTNGIGSYFDIDWSSMKYPRVNGQFTVEGFPATSVDRPSRLAGAAISLLTKELIYDVIKQNREYLRDNTFIWEKDAATPQLVPK